VGLPRSGTKLLRDLLNRHPRIGIPEVETEFLPWLHARAAALGGLADTARFDALWEELMRRPYFEYRREAGVRLDPAVVRAMCATADAAGLFEALLRIEVGAPRGSGRIWGDKSPSHVAALPLIASLYPRARVVHLVRDVRDHCVSTHEAWGKDMRRAAQRWADGVLAARDDGRRALGAAYREVRYEDLVADPAGTMRSLCAFVGVEFRPETTTLLRPAENLGTTRGLTAVATSGAGRWARAMPAAVLRDVEAFAGAAMDVFGYARALPAMAPRRMSTLAMRGAQLRDGWNLARTRADGKGFWHAVRFHLRYHGTTRGGA
jgi:hypothetical protein